MKSKKKTFPFKIKWRTHKNEGFFERPTLTTTDALISGKLIFCIVLSIVSAFIDIVFFSGLSKSGYPFFGAYVPAAIILSIMSLGFSGSKFFVAMQLAAIKEIEGRLKKQLKENYHHRLIWLKTKWHLIHKFLIAISVITSISLSVITIGNGVRQMEQNILNQSNDAQYLIDLKSDIRNDTAEKRSATKDNIAGARKAQDTSSSEVNFYVERLKKYQSEYFAIADNESLSDEEKDKQQQAVINKIVKEIPGTSARNAIYFTEADLKKSIQKVASSNEVLDTSALYDESIAYNENELNTYILALQEKNYRTPDGELIMFVNEDGTPVNKEVAISRLQNSIMLWQTDTGDAGPSSKVFTLIATYIKVDERAGGMGTSEWIMMALIMIFGIVQEFIIAAFTPRATISRKMLSQFSEYFYDVDINKFMLDTYESYYNLGLLKTEEYERKCEKAVHLLDNSVDKIIAKYKNDDKKNPEIEKLESDLAWAESEADKYKQQAEGYLNTAGDFHRQLNEEQAKNEQLTNDLLAKDDLVQDLKFQLAQKENEIAELKVVEAPAVVEAKIEPVKTEVEPVKTERKIKREIIKEPKEAEFSSAVDKKAKEVEALL